MTIPNPIRKFTLACAAVGSLASVHAETYLETANIPATSNWNAAAVWGGNAVTSGNDYQTNPNTNPNYPGGSPGGTDFTVVVGGVSTPWRYWNQVRDNGGTGLVTSDLSFDGNNLIVASDTRFLSKNRLHTTTANWILQNNSYLYLSPGGSGTAGTATFEGTISATGNTLIGFETTSALAQGFNVAADISGSGLLTLTGKGGDAATMSLTGNLDLFTGTFLLTSVAAKTAGALTFSMASSASFATLQLNWNSPLFFYDLAESNVVFGELILGAGDTALALGSGTYDADYLNGLTGNTGIFSGTGTITVVPEPSTYALATAGLLGALAFMHRSRRHTIS